MKTNEQGLIPAIVQEARTGQILMLAWMNDEALRLTRETGSAHYYSRSRQSIWRKGETSGHTQRVVELRIDCDEDTVLMQVEQTGPACHTNEPSCFYRDLSTDDYEHLPPPPATTLDRLQAILTRRRSADPSSSYTAKLLAGGVDSVAAKVREEADELCDALAGETDERVVSETADQSRVAVPFRPCIATPRVSLRPCLLCATY